MVNLDRLEKLKRLHDAGALTDEEYTEQKRLLIEQHRDGLFKQFAPVLYLAAAFIAIAGILAYFLVVQTRSDINSASQNVASAQGKVLPTPVASPSSTTASSPVAVDDQKPSPLEHLSAEWLVGSWVSSPRKPGESCDTDDAVTFDSAGIFGDGASSGRYRIIGDKINYYDREPSAEDADESASDEGQAKLKPLTTHITIVSQNVMYEDGVEMWRCRGAG